MKVKVDQDACVGCELCVDSCPEVFEMIDNVSKPKKEIVPADQEDCVKDAAEDCPVEAIIIEE